MLTSLAISALLIQSGGWEALAPPPDEPGAGAACATYDGSFYAMRGGGTGDFSRCPADGSGWIPCSALPVAVTNGGAITAGSTPYLYALAGSHLWRYSIDLDSWNDLGATPDLLGSGAAIARVWNRLFVLRGNRTTDFWRY